MIIGLTGTIGSGKSTVSNRLITLGAAVLDADKLARKAVEPKSGCLMEIERCFGKDIIADDGSLIRSELAKIIFDDEKKRETLNAIIHPWVLGELRRQSDALIKADKSSFIVWDVPLLIETGWHGLVEYVWVVNAEKNVRLSRILKRDNCTIQQAQKRIAAQMSDEEKAACADELIDNSASLEELYQNVDSLYKKYVEISRKGSV